ncbi:hypothetical protein H6788_00615 [Candidatus Nomurabacteria bacterium]|nr:hypothetical protein [Candidatus Nomurabacteria bacterium]MCB9819414.1 hypothetical protein [Candidatus Nomurabacteria bacterium]
MNRDLSKQIEALIASDEPVLSALESLGYVIVIDQFFGVGVLSTDGGVERTCYHPMLSLQYKQTADP